MLRQNEVFRSLVAFAVTVFFAASAAFAAPAERQKVIIDTDMVELFDDGAAMIMLANAPNVEVLGVTCVSGNSWSREGIAYTIRQLELEGLNSIPVAAGMQYPIRAQRHDRFELERQQYGMGHDPWLGSFGRPEPKSWQEFYRQRYGADPKLTPITQHAVNFIIDTIRKYPNEVTLVAIGPCSNIAAAIRMAPDIVPLVKRVVYMGGAFFQPGNVTPSAEFNLWFDPEAAQIVIRSAFKEQIVFGLDVCEKVVFRKEHYDRFHATLGKSPLSAMLEKTIVGVRFGQDPNFTHFVWDVLVAAYVIDPSIVTSEQTCKVDVDIAYGLDYGHAVAFPGLAPEGCQTMRIVTEVDQKRFWDMLNDKTYWKSAR